MSPFSGMHPAGGRAAIARATLCALVGLSGCAVEGHFDSPGNFVIGTPGALAKGPSHPGKGSVLYESFTPDYHDDFSPDDESVVQHALTNNRDGAGTTWHNPRRGDLIIFTGQTQTGHGYTCREYYISYAVVNVGRYQQKNSGVACLEGARWVVDPDSVSMNAIDDGPSGTGLKEYFKARATR